MHFKNQKKHIYMASLENKKKITTTKLGNVQSKIEEIRAKIDQSRRQRQIEAKVDKEKMQQLKDIQQNLKLTQMAVNENKDNTGEFEELIIPLEVF